MSSPTPVTPASTQESPGADAPTAQTTPAHLPSVRTDLPPAEILRKLDAAARRGKLAGFTPPPAGSGGGPLFTVRDVGTPFDGEVVATFAGGVLSFTARLFRKMPTIFIVVLVLSVWPGEWFMRSLMKAYWPSVSDYTAWWYIPLTLISGPPAYFAAMKKSRAALHEDAVGVVEAVEKALG